MKSEKTKPRSRLARFEAAAVEAAAIKRGVKTGARTRTPAEMVKGLRTGLKLSQAEFSSKYAISIGTLRDWENGRRQPDGAALAFLRVISYAPDTVAEALKEVA